MNVLVLPSLGLSCLFGLFIFASPWFCVPSVALLLFSGMVFWHTSSWDKVEAAELTTLQRSVDQLKTQVASLNIVAGRRV